MTHLALADTNGRSVAVEYINNEIVVIETPVVTNFYLAEGDKYGIGTEQPHERYDILNRLLSENKTADMAAVGNANADDSYVRFGNYFYFGGDCYDRRKNSFGGAE